MSDLITIMQWTCGVALLLVLFFLLTNGPED